MESPELQAFKKVQLSLGGLLRGKEDVIELSLSAILSGGHILLEGPPGTGKTSLARGLANAFGGDFRRIQMTSDLLPSDIIGFLRLKPGAAELEFRPGPIFTHFLLADELNRCNPKTQSALLEAMAESTVTVDGVTHTLPQPFFVVATQNPLESHGVYPLAESQLDRFMLQIPFHFPKKEDELEIYRTLASSGFEPIPVQLSLSELLRIREKVRATHIHPNVLEYMNELTRGSREFPEISYGVSVRGGMHLISASKALAFLRGRDFVSPLEVQDLALPVLAHRICFTDGTDDYARKCELISRLLKAISPPQ